MSRFGAVLLAAALALPAVSSAITRDQVLARARAFAFHPWRMTTANVRGTCGSAYRSIYTPGDYMGLPYDWGGYMSLFEFDRQIAAGAGAGSYPADGVLSCTAGLDCSGFLSKCWDTGHYTTSNLATISTRLASTSDLLPGDAMNLAGTHVVLFSHRTANGQPVFIESVDYNVHVNATGGWSYVSGYSPLRYKNITGTGTTDPAGTTTRPIDVATTPFTDTRDTRQSASDVFDGCAAAATTNESGPEYVYRIKLDRPGRLVATVTDDVGVDIDVHLYNHLNTSDCVARNDRTVDTRLDCGTYYIVADTYVSSAGVQAGLFTLNVSFTPESTACGAGPRGYDFEGAPGEPCAYPGDESLPFCNPNLGGETCVYTPSLSFCSHRCAAPSDCTEYPGGCCGQLADGDSYCFIGQLCQPSVPDAGTPDAGTRPDAGTPDAGRDAGTAVPDAGHSHGGADAGAVPDAGRADAGGYADAGLPPYDAGRPDSGADAGNVADAGHRPDAGAGRDAGPAEPRDAGGWDSGFVWPRRDGGNAWLHDAGPGDEPAEGGGCGCDGAGGTAGLGALLLAAARMRRRPCARV